MPPNNDHPNGFNNAKGRINRSKIDGISLML